MLKKCRRYTGYPQPDPSPATYAPRFVNDPLDPRRPVSSGTHPAMTPNASYPYQYGSGGPYGDVKLPDASISVENSLGMGQSAGQYLNRIAYPNEPAAEPKQIWSTLGAVSAAGPAQSPLNWNGSTSRTLPPLSDLNGQWTAGTHGPIHLAPLSTPTQQSPMGQHRSMSRASMPTGGDREPRRIASLRQADGACGSEWYQQYDEPAIGDSLGIGGEEHPSSKQRRHIRRFSQQSEPPSKRPRLDGNKRLSNRSKSASPQRGKGLPRIRRTEDNVLGMSGIVTEHPDGGLNGLRWWGGLKPVDTPVHRQ
jgi:hypothetical protein